MENKRINRVYQKRYYDRQKREGGNIVYKLTLKDGNTYIGASINSIRVRIGQLWTQKHGILKDFDLEGMVAEVLEYVGPDDDLRDREQYWISELEPSLNSRHATYQGENNYYSRITKRTEGGNSKVVTYRGTVYINLYQMWSVLGKTKISTFRTRLSRYPGNYGYALGLEESPKAGGTLIAGTQTKELQEEIKGS